MRKLLISALVAIGSLTPTAFAFADNVVTGVGTDTITVTNNGSYIWWGPNAPDPDDTIDGGSCSGVCKVENTGVWAGILGGSTEYFFNDDAGSCTGLSLTACKALADSNSGVQYIGNAAGYRIVDGLWEEIVAEEPPPESSGGISGIINDGETAFQVTTGTSLGAAVAWSGDNLIKPWVGSGIALFGSLAEWIAAIAAIGAIVFFTFRALNKGLNESNNRRIVSGGSSPAPKKKKEKPSFQKGGGYQAYKLREALKKGKYKDSKVHSAFGKNWT